MLVIELAVHILRLGQLVPGVANGSLAADLIATTRDPLALMRYRSGVLSTGTLEHSFRGDINPYTGYCRGVR